MAKGSGMINPNMATMLCFITTDCAIAKPMLDKALKDAVADSFNMICVDGDMSTNDTVLALAMVWLKILLLIAKTKIILSLLKHLCLLQKDLLFLVQMTARALQNLWKQM